MIQDAIRSWPVVYSKNTELLHRPLMRTWEAAYKKARERDASANWARTKTQMNWSRILKLSWNISCFTLLLPISVTEHLTLAIGSSKTCRKTLGLKICFSYLCSHPSGQNGMFVKERCLMISISASCNCHRDQRKYKSISNTYVQKRKICFSRGILDFKIISTHLICWVNLHKARALGKAPKQTL